MTDDPILRLRRALLERMDWPTPTAEAAIAFVEAQRAELPPDAALELERQLDIIARAAEDCGGSGTTMQIVARAWELWRQPN